MAVYEFYATFIGNLDSVTSPNLDAAYSHSIFHLIDSAICLQ